MAMAIFISWNETGFGWWRAAFENVAQHGYLLGLLDYDSLRQAAKAGIAAEQKLEARHFYCALMMRDHRAREIAVRVPTGSDTHSGVHLGHDSAERCIEFVPGSRPRRREPLTLDLGCQGCADDRKHDAGDDGAGVTRNASDHVLYPLGRRSAKSAPDRSIAANSGAHGLPP